MEKTIKQEFTIEEWTSLSDSLSKFHTIFYRFWTVSRPIFTDSVNTAAVRFDKEGNCIEFMLNYDFWESQTHTQKLFIICHECQHLILNHGKRAKRLFNKGADIMKKLNVAMDICVNESLVERYGFIREEIDPTNKYVWADKVGQALGIDLPSNKCFEYYYNLFQKAPEGAFNDSGSTGASAFGETVDDHSEPSSGDIGSEALERLAEELDEGELEELENMLSNERNKIFRDNEGVVNKAGNDPLGHTFKINSEPVKPKKKWETVIKKWTSKFLVMDAREEEQWARTSRRFAVLGSSLSLPFEMEVESINNQKEKIDIWFFLDTSGSCIHLAERFFKAAKSLPPSKFNIHLFCFDTGVYPSDLKRKRVIGGGGTRFDILEKYILKETVMKEKKYPDGVFVITDGGGNPVNPKKPGNWFWFLSEMDTRFIPPGSKIYNLKEFE